MVRFLPLPLPAAELLPERLQLPIEAPRQVAHVLLHPGAQPGDRQLQLLQLLLHCALAAGTRSAVLQSCAEWRFEQPDAGELERVGIERWS
jgi:hypothetical protein